MPSKTSILLVCLGAIMMMRVEGFPFGAPNFACRSMRPNHPDDYQPTETFPANIAFVPDRALPGQLIDVHVWVKNPGDRFQGLLVTARPLSKPDSLVAGFLVTNTTHFKVLRCTSSTGPNGALTHRTELYADRTSFKWKVPDDASVGSTYLLRFTMVKNFTTYWVGINTTFTVGRPSFRPHPLDRTSLTAPNRTSGGGSASQMTPTATPGTSPSGGQRSPPRVGPRRHEAGTPSSASPSQLTPTRTGNGHNRTGSASRVPSRATQGHSGSSRAIPREQGTVPGGAQERVMTEDQLTVPQTNLVAGVQNPHAGRTNTLPEGQGREQRGWGIASSGTEGQSSGFETETSAGGDSPSGGMSAWLLGWFGP